MGTSRFVGDRLLVDEEHFYVRGAEIHYFRLPADVWRDRLEKAVAGGVNTVSSYMPWYWHEPEEGRFDLTGSTRAERDLRGLLDLAAELGLKVIARPGPFVNSELRCGGIPEWLFRNHPETLSHRGDGSLCTGRPIPAEGEPLYRQYVRRWYEAVVPLLAEYDAHRGGPIILFQPDNELSAAWSFGLLNSLYDPTILAETWPGWLQERYGDAAAAGAQHEQEYGSFAEVEPPRAFPRTSGEKRLCRDWLDFKRWFFADWGATMAQWAQKLGMQVPMIFNEPVAGFYNHGDHAGFGAEMRTRGLAGATAYHAYSDRIIDLEGVLGSVMGLELTKSSPWGGAPMAVEVNTNWFIPRLCRSELNWEPLLRVHLARGLRGSVVYPYAAAFSPLEDTIEGPLYFDPGCVDVEGHLTGSFRQVKRYHRLEEAWHAELAAARMPAEVTIGYTAGMRVLDFLGAPPLLGAEGSAAGPGGEKFSAEPALERGAAGPSHDWLDGYEGVSRQTVPAEAGLWKRVQEAALLLLRMNLGFDMCNLVTPDREPGEGLFIVPSTGSLERAAQDWCREHLQRGGRLLLFPTVPVLDEDGNPYTALAEALGVKLTAQVRPAGGEIIDYGTRVAQDRAGADIGLEGWLYLHELPAESRVLATYQGSPILAQLPAWEGRVVLAGADMRYTTLPVMNLWWEALGEALAVEPLVGTAGTYHHAILCRGADMSFLLVANLEGIAGEGTLHVRQPVESVEHLSFPVRLRPQEARLLPLGPRLGGVRLLYATSEVIPLTADRRRVELHGAAGTAGELAFQEPVTGKLRGRDVASEARDGLHVIGYTHAAEPLEFVLTSH